MTGIDLLNPGTQKPLGGCVRDHAKLKTMLTGPSYALLQEACDFMEDPSLNAQERLFLVGKRFMAIDEGEQSSYWRLAAAEMLHGDYWKSMVKIPLDKRDCSNVFAVAPQYYHLPIADLKQKDLLKIYAELPLASSVTYGDWLATEVPVPGAVAHCQKCPGDRVISR